MDDAIFSVTYRGAADWGMALMFFRRGKVIGADVAGITYNGDFAIDGDAVRASLAMSVPPGVALVQGTPAQAIEATYEFSIVIPTAALESGEPVLLDLPMGAINAIFRRLTVVTD